MARWLADDDDSAPFSGGGLALLAVGLLAGLAAGAYMAHRLGGVSGLAERVRRGLKRRAFSRRGRGAEDDVADDDTEGTDDESMAARADNSVEALYEAGTEEWVEEGDAEFDEDADFGEDEDITDEDMRDDGDGFASADPELEDRVLEAFMNDPVLKERAVDIGAINPGTVELTGTVYTDEEYEHATILARGVPGVVTVVNRLTVEEDEAAEDDAAARYRAGDPRYTEARWESDIIGTGRTRQGTSQDVGRHADPKVPLETRATSEAEALRDAADDADAGTGTTRRGSPRGTRGGSGSTTRDTGVPKADHVENPESSRG